MNDKQVSIRLPSELLDRAQELAERLSARPEYRLMRVTRGAVLRQALERGLVAMDAETRPKRK